MCVIYLFQVLMLFTCGHCPQQSTTFTEIVKHLVTNHSDKEIKFKKVDGKYMRTLNFKIIPELFREQGRSNTTLHSLI